MFLRISKAFKPTSFTPVSKFYFSQASSSVGRALTLIRDAEQKLQDFEVSYRTLMINIPSEIKDQAVREQIQQLQRLKSEMFPQHRYTINISKKRLIDPQNYEMVIASMENVQQSILDINQQFEDLLLKLNQTVPNSKVGTEEARQVASKIMEIKNKVTAYIQEAYINNKASLGTFAKNYYLAMLALTLLGYLYYKSRPTQISLERFIQMKENSNITQVDIVTIEGPLSTRRVQFDVNGTTYFVLVDTKEQLDQFMRRNPNVRCEHKKRLKFMGYFEKYFQIVWIVDIFLLILLNAIVLWYFSKNKGASMEGIMSQGDKKTFDMVKETGVRFKDVIGLGESKHQIEEFVDFLKNSDKYKKLGAKIPRGVLLTGPPGTGKTLLAKACAGEAGVPFFYCSGSDFVQIFVGVGAARVRDLFNAARQVSPAIVFIDEIDGVGKKRSKQGRNDQRDGTLNQLLVEMDGFSTNHNVVVMGATNRRELLDDALTRPGRFDRIVDIALPDLEGRFDMFMMYLLSKPLKGSLQDISRRMSTLTPGFSGAEIANLCNQAAILAARANKQTIELIDLQNATERIIGGLERKNLMDEDDRRIVAVHESGHAVVAWFLEGAYPLLKVSIVPRSKGALGYAQYLPKESHLDSKEELLDRISYILAGRCAQEYFFQSVTTGAADDIQKAYEIAYSLVTRYGMSEELGLIGYDDKKFVRQYSKSKGKVIDQEIKKIIDNCIIVTKELIARHGGLIKELSDRLLQKETLNSTQIIEVLGSRPFKPHSTYQKYLQLFGKTTHELLQDKKEQPKQEPKEEPQEEANKQPKV